MKLERELIEKIKRDVEEKKTSRRTLLDQIAIVDGEISLIDELIKNLDRKALGFINKINPTVKPVKDAYVDRVAAGCKSDLVWEEGESISFFRLGGFVTTKTYKVVKNPAERRVIPYYGIKFYQKPLDRDYGSTVVGTFIGSVEDMKPVIAVTDIDGLPPSIQVGDIITDSLNIPKIFSLGNLPKVTGIGETDSIGVVTSLIGGIEQGSNTFFHFGAGSLTNVEVGMVLSDTLVGSGVIGEEGQEKIFPDNTLITGFSTGQYPIEYFDEDGILQESTIDVSTINLSNTALNTLVEGEVSVGIITTYPALFLTTNASSTEYNIEFIALRVDENIDFGFDYESNPNAPLKIGTISGGNIGVGGSAFLDKSGLNNNSQTWDPNTSYLDTFISEDECRARSDGRWVGNGCQINPEPRIGAGGEVYYRGNERWPTYRTRSSQESPLITRYASLGTTVRISSADNSSIGYANQPQGGFPSNCGNFDSTIQQREQVNSNAISQNEPPAESNIQMSAALRREREGRQLYAWSLLQASSKLLEEIRDGEELIRQIDQFEF